jgi:hypothetical protein
MQRDALAGEIHALRSARGQDASRAADLRAALSAEEAAHARTGSSLTYARQKVRRMAPLCMQPSPAHSIGTTSSHGNCHAVLLGFLALLHEAGRSRRLQEQPIACWGRV